MGRCAPAAWAAALGLLGLGCGTTTVPRDEFQRRGNAVCAATAVRVAQLAAPAASARPTPETVAGYVDAYVAEIRQELADLRRIGYPAGERRRLSRAYAAVEAVLTGVERDPLSFRASSLAPAAARLREVGLTACRP